MVDQQQDDPDRRSGALTAHFVKVEALRAAEIAGTQSSSLEAVLARISAQATAEAVRQRVEATQELPHRREALESADDAKR